MKVRWFGHPWPSETSRAPVCDDDAYRVERPVGKACIYCPDPIRDRERGVVMACAAGDELGFDLDVGSRVYHVCACHIDCLGIATVGPEIAALAYPARVHPSHYLVIEGHDDDGPIWEVEHDPSCPSAVLYYDVGGEPELGSLPIRDYRCDVGAEVQAAGLDSDTLEGWEDLPPGRYEIRAWSKHYPSTPVSGEEFDGGLEFVRRIAKEG